tara:strand:+ start:1693 stop:2094 length:402 start_codon:yes stop_codon:yes gene_type:complete
MKTINKMKQKVINVSYRKNSNSFEDWMKYEIEILNEDNTKELIPAYGKDLQDALSRVVHDKKVKKIETKVINKVPLNGWVLAWFLGLSILILSIYSTVEHRYAGLWIVGSMVIYTFMTLSISNWFSLRNKDKK